ncbi:DUF4328 domain-containing protein [Streptomyces sp. NPDC056486]|uniref:DUF4328 domain-containing protein n=1 Tax=Streptomyces sp. NPDC056486 TaxID=3345835 RepID=UPI00367E97A5
MLCTQCQFNTATTADGLCGICVSAAAHAQPAPAPRPGYASNGSFAYLRSPVALARATVALLVGVIAADLYSLWAGTVVQGVMDDLMSLDRGVGYGVVGGGTDLVREAERADTLYSVSGWLQTAALVATCVVFLCWFYRVRVNAEVFEPHIHSKTRGWTVGSWFVPVVNLWFPRRIALDIWDASGDRSVALDRTMTLGDASARATHPLVNGWWTLWVASLVVGRWASSGYWAAEEADEIDAAISRMMLADVLDIAAAVMAILFVRRLTRMQDAKARSTPTEGFGLTGSA